MPLSASEARAAAGYAGSLRLGPGVTIAPGWQQAESVMRETRSGTGWWTQEEAERGSLMRETGQRIGQPLLLETLTAAVEGHAETTFARAREAGGDETLARVASGAALMAIHNRALALLAGRGPDHVFVQKYALFASGRWPLGTQGNKLILF